MFEENYKSLFRKIPVNEEHKEQTREKMVREMNEMNIEGKRINRNNRFNRYAAVAAMVAVLLLTTTALFKLFGSGNTDNPIAEEETPPPVVETPEQEETTVLYSTLNFSESVQVEAPIALGGMTDKIAAFTEDILGESSAVIKGTVMNIRFKDYTYVIESGEDQSEETQAARQSVIYEVRVDKIYNSSLPFSVDETILIENDLYTYTSLASSVEKLNINRQYILALYENEGEVYVEAETENVENTEKLESNLSVLYPFTPQIEITKDGQYLFPDHWKALLNDKTKTVIMNGEEGFGYYGEMKLREDLAFEDDFQKVVDTYTK